MIELNNHVCIVDNDTFSAETHAVLMRHAFGLKSEIFTDACSALRHLLLSSTECVGIITDSFIYDEHCPIKNGIDFTRMVRSMGIDVPVLFCSGISGEVELNIMKKHGLVCEKPMQNNMDEKNNDLRKFIDDINIYTYKG